MPIRLDYAVSKQRFGAALELARAGDALPTEWMERARKVGRSPSKTFVAMLGTALLAKATDPRIDPFSLKTRKLRNAYSARSLCKDVLVPCAVEAGIQIGTTGREPLNNQPFFRHERVAPNMHVHARVRPHLEYLCASLDAMNGLDRTQALRALAAFLRARIEDAPPETGPLDARTVHGLPELTAMTSRFVSENPENGRRGQALVAVCMDLVFPDVRTTRVFDPSRHWPGDVVARKGNRIVLAAEVKQRPATETEIVQFAGRCKDMRVRRAIVALLDPAQEPLQVDAVRDEAWRVHGVHLTILGSVEQVMQDALIWSHYPLEEALELFAERMAVRLAELEVSEEARAQWANFFAAED